MTEFDDVIRHLRENRPEATELELDQIKQRARRRAARPSRRNQDMKSRFAILSMLVLGMLLSTTGAGLAVQGLTAGDDDAGVAQYGQSTPTTPPEVVPPPVDAQVVPPPADDQVTPPPDDDQVVPPASDVEGEEDTSPPDDDSDTAPASDDAPAPEAVQPARQVEVGAQSGGGQLPFTGFAAIPVLLGGVALLSGGLILRRRALGDDES